MINVRKVLYATDFSSHSNQAYFHALELAEGYDASLIILHVYVPARAVPMAVDFGAVPFPVSDSSEEREHWRNQLEQIRPLNQRLAVSHVLLEGDPAEEIIRYATAEKVDLIVLGTHGRTGLERLVLGSVAEKVLRGARCSVLVVKIPKAAPVPEMSDADEALCPA